MSVDKDAREFDRVDDAERYLDELFPKAWSCERSYYGDWFARVLKAPPGKGSTPGRGSSTQLEAMNLLIAYLNDAKPEAKR